MKDLSVSRPRCRTPEIIVFGVESNLPETDIILTILEQTEDLQGASLELRTTFTDKRDRNIVLAVDERSYERLAGTRNLNVCWCQADSLPNRRLMVCFRCCKFGHTQTVCHSACLCGRCVVSDHVQMACTADDCCCPNSRNRNRRRADDKKLSTVILQVPKSVISTKLKVERLRRVAAWE